MEAPSKAVEIKAAITAIIAFGSALWGTAGWTILILIICIILDYVSGSLAAVHNGEWSSAVARQGLWHKLGEIFALLVAALCDIALNVLMNSTISPALENVPLPDAALTLIVSVWYIFTELGSITENAAALGAPIPEWLKKALAKIKEKAEPSDSDNK